MERWRGALVLGLFAVQLAACGAPADLGAWYGGAPDAASCEGRGGVQAGSVCQFETDLRHQDFFFNHFIDQHTARLTPSSSVAATLVLTGAKSGDRIEWEATGVWGQTSEGCSVLRDLSGSANGLLMLNEGQPQGLMALEEGGAIQVLGTSGQVQIQGSGAVWIGFNTPTDDPECWQVWPTRFSLLHCEDTNTQATVPCP